VLYLFLLLYVTVLYVRPSEVFSSLAEVPIVDILTVCSIPIAALATMMRRRRFILMPTDLCVLGIWVAIVLSNLTWGWFGGAWAGFLAFMPVVFCYFLVRVTLVSPGQFRGFVYLLVALNLFQAVNGIVQYHTGTGLGGVVTIGGEHRIRGTGIFNDPNDLGMTLVMTTPFVLGGLFAAGAKMRHRLSWLLILAPILVAMYYTNSRGTVIGMGAVLIAFGYRRLRRISGTLVGAAAVLVLVIFGPSRTSAMDASEDSAQSRVEAWGEGLGMLKANPVFGVGFGRFLEFHYKVAHNSIVHTFAELGLLGAFFLVGCFYGFFRATRLLGRSGTADPESFQWSTMLSVSAVGAVACGFFLSRQYVVVPYILLAMGLSCATMRIQDAKPFWLNPVLQVAAVGLLTAGSVVAIWILVRTLGAW
jgi:putative inorganic carbon (HCO3(-)) transporter